MSTTVWISLERGRSGNLMAIASISGVNKSSGVRGRRLEGGKADAADVDDLLDVDASLAFLFGRRFFFFELAFPPSCRCWSSMAGGGGGGGRLALPPATVPPGVVVVVVTVGPRIGEISRERRLGGGGGLIAGTGGKLVDVAVDAASITVEDKDDEVVDGPLRTILLRLSDTSTVTLSLPTLSRRSATGFGRGRSSAAGTWR